MCGPVVSTDRKNAVVLSESARIQLIAIINSLKNRICDLQEFAGNKPTSMTSSTTLQPNGNIRQSNSVKAKSGSYHDGRTQGYGDGSRSTVNFNVVDAAEYSYGFTRDDNQQYVGETLSATNANGIFACAIADNPEGDHSESSVQIEDGSIKGYSNEAQAHKTGVFTSQKADSASVNDNSPYEHSIDFNQVSSNNEGDLTEAYPFLGTGWAGWSNDWAPVKASINNYYGTSEAEDR